MYVAGVHLYCMIIFLCPLCRWCDWIFTCWKYLNHVTSVLLLLYSLLKWTFFDSYRTGTILMQWTSVLHISAVQSMYKCLCINFLINHFTCLKYFQIISPRDTTFDFMSPESLSLEQSPFPFFPCCWLGVSSCGKSSFRICLFPSLEWRLG